MFHGVDHIGVGVSDMNRSLKFYGDLLGFTEIVFDYTGPLPGMQKVSGKPETNARVVMLRNQNRGPIGLGMIKLVYLLPPDKAKPIPDDEIWGQTGIAEIAINTRNSPAKFGELVLKGAKPSLPPAIPDVFPPYENNVVGLSYITDPDGGKLELIEWKGMCPGLGTEPRIEGANHVAFGVSDMDSVMKFYRELGFTDLVFDFDGYVDSMAIWFPKPHKMKILCVAGFGGAWIEPIQDYPPSRKIGNNWGRLGPMEFAVGVSDIEKAYTELQKKGIKFLNSPQTMEVSCGQLKYAYMVAPDNLCVSLVEPRY